ncbi:sugar-binding transcriptional regulator [Buttiauxella warmboldiae]|uniref:Sugar-binding transcriptional regulator n=1 Tax=Buttiauxella warmboldiae TaxID=82993 RepID=A0A3N5E542_9ENTR|nr:sugar-binding domain-containing protein [Buttiauxella warmboldiae]RPH30209.1 sugar-binding transcriptional regulator [Buttiauxella warmboldiae]
MIIREKILQESQITQNENALIARICWHYFREGQTQDVIARHLNITRKKVNRILGEARTSGFVQIILPQAVAVRNDLENTLSAKYNLSRVIVVPAPIAGDDVREMVGAAAGQYVSENLPPSGMLGISWGGTIHSAARHFLPRAAGGDRVVLLCGGLAESTSINPYDNAASVARALEAKCFYITAPMFAPSQALRDALVASEPVKSVLAMAGQLDMALLSAVDLSEQSKALEYGVIDRASRLSLIAAGAVGDICGHYLDAQGKTVIHPLAQRVINPAIADLKKTGQLVLAAGGSHKYAIILAAIRAGLCHVLICDENVAQALAAA